LPINSLGCVVAESDSQRYIGTVNGGFADMFDTAFVTYNIVNGGFPDNSVLGIVIDLFGYKWCATPAGGLVRFYGTSGYAFNLANSTIPSESFDAVDVDSAGNVYLGSFDKGVVRKQGNNFMSYNTTNSPMPDDVVYSVKVERTGIIWAGTSVEGVVRIDEPLFVPTPEIASPREYKVYPNPVKDLLTIKSAQADVRSVRIINTSGQTVFEKTNVSLPRTIDMSALPPGIYFLSVVSNGKAVSKKVIKM
jgi:hypothetical protein